jgi:hypothetical protein
VRSGLKECGQGSRDVVCCGRAVLCRFTLAWLCSCSAAMSRLTVPTSTSAHYSAGSLRRRQLLHVNVVRHLHAELSWVAAPCSAGAVAPAGCVTAHL